MNSLSFKQTFPDIDWPSLIVARLLIMLRSEVLPAPEAPIMNVVCPGRAKPVAPLSTSSYLVFAPVSSFSLSVVGISTVNLISVNDILTGFLTF